MPGRFRYSIALFAWTALSVAVTTRAVEATSVTVTLQADSVARTAERLYDAGNYEAASRYYENYVQVLRSRFGGDHEDIVQGMIWLSAAHWKMGRHARGEQVARDAIDMAKRVHGENHSQVGEALNMCGLCCMAQGKFDEAEGAYRAAMALFREQVGDESEEVAMCLNNLGALAGERSEWIRADVLYRASLRLNRELFGDDNLRVARSMHNIGFAAMARGNALEARHFLEQALDMRRRHLGDDHPDVALTLQTLARTYRRDDPDQACELFEDVLELRRRTLGERHPHVAWALRDLSRKCTARNGNYDLAEEQLREALSIYEDADEPMEHARTVRELAMVKAHRGEFAEAEALMAQAREMGLGAVGRTRSTTLQFLATLRCMDGRYTEAESLLVAAVDAFEEARVPYSDNHLLMSFQSPYPLLAATYLWQGKTDRAWPAIERSRGRGFIDHLNEGGNRAGRVRSLEDVQKVLGPEEAIVGWLDVAHFGQAAGAWVYVIRNHGPVYWSQLKPGSTRNDDGRDQWTEITERPVQFREALRYAAAWATRVTDVGRVTRDANALWRERLAPAEAHLRDIDRLIVISSEMMNGIPIEALVDDDGVALVNRFEVSYAPSATLYCWLADRNSGGDSKLERALLVGDPPFSREHLDGPTAVAMAPVTDAKVLRSALAGSGEALATLPALPESQREVTAIASNVSRPTVLLGRDASEEAVARLLLSGDLCRYDVVHFATHAIIDAAFPELSALILSQVDLPDVMDIEPGREVTDGLITVDEIFDRWDLNAELVTLSGCQTALGRRIAGEGYLGFAQAFIHAGARSVLLSLWDVDDTATSLFMTRFYENLTGNYNDARNGFRDQAMTKTAALQEAKQWLRSYRTDGSIPFAHPAYWASFVLIGDG